MIYKYFTTNKTSPSGKFNPELRGLVRLKREMRLWLHPSLGSVNIETSQSMHQNYLQRYPFILDERQTTIGKAIETSYKVKKENTVSNLMIWWQTHRQTWQLLCFRNVLGMWPMLTIKCLKNPPKGMKLLQHNKSQTYFSLIRPLLLTNLNCALRKSPSRSIATSLSITYRKGSKSR